MTSSSEFYLTISIFCVGLVTMGLMVLAERRPKTVLTPSLIPTTPILYGALIIAMLAGVHLLNLFGFHTGR